MVRIKDKITTRCIPRNMPFRVMRERRPQVFLPRASGDFVDTYVCTYLIA